MSKLPSMPMWWADFFSKTDHLSNEEQWAYAKLLAKTWLRNAQPFPDNPRDLARLLNMGVKRWLTIRSRIAPFFDLSDGTWRQERLENEFRYVAQRNEISRSNGARGGRPKIRRVNEIENPAGFLQAIQTETTHTHTHIDTSNEVSSARERQPKNSRKKPASPLPEAWSPCQQDIDYAAGRGFGHAWVAEQAERFRDHHLKTGKMYSDWCAAWRTWVQNAPSFDRAPITTPAPKPNGYAKTDPRALPLEEPWQQRLASWRRDGWWLDTWGARPGQSGCRAPVDLLLPDEMVLETC